jgi:XisI protein
MDRLKYREVLQSTVNHHAKFQPANGNIKTHAVCDTENDDYMVVDSGWNEKGR